MKQEALGIFRKFVAKSICEQMLLLCELTIFGGSAFFSNV